MSWGYLCGNRGEQAETFPFNFVPFGTITFLFYYKHTLLLEFKKKFFLITRSVCLSWIICEMVKKQTEDLKTMPTLSCGW